MTAPTRVLQVGGAEQCPPDGLPTDDVTRTDTWQAAEALLARERFDALVADLRDPTLLAAVRTARQAERILARLGDGIAVVAADQWVWWANPTFDAWCGGPAVGHNFYDALGATAPAVCPFQSALADQPTADGAPARATAWLRGRNDRILELQVTRLEADPPRFVALCHDTTVLVRKQQTLDALHRAGRELAAIDPGLFADLDVTGRIDLLKVNIRRLIRDLLPYRSIEIRLLDATTGKLVPLLQDGMDAEDTSRELYARPEGNGVTGYVAATGTSHLCPDTAADPRYLPGAVGARSSLTVPLRLGDRIIGTFNVESPHPNDFGEEDLQFADIFSHAVAAALNTLELFNVEKSSGASQSIEAVNREVALPVDDILADATSLLDRYVGHSQDVLERIRKIIGNARLIKQSIAKVGADLAPPPRPAAIRESAAPLRGVRVLVADNDDHVRRSAHQLIGRWGGTVETARDGQEAVTMARLADYDAILVDIHLPDLSGYEAYRKLRQTQPNARIVLMTGFGYDPGHSIVKARQDGCRHVLYKPFRVDQLRDALATLRKDDG